MAAVEHCCSLYQESVLLLRVSLSPEGASVVSGVPNDNFRKISVRKTICDLEFSEHLFKISCWPASPRIFEHLKNGIIADF